MGLQKSIECLKEWACIGWRSGMPCREAALTVLAEVERLLADSKRLDLMLEKCRNERGYFLTTFIESREDIDREMATTADVEGGEDGK